MSQHASPADLEHAILSVLRTLLKRDDIGRSENFFDLGADSLLLVQARQELSAMLGRELTDLELFTYPNVAALVAHLSDRETAPAGSEGADRARQRLARLSARRERPDRV